MQAALARTTLRFERVSEAVTGHGTTRHARGIPLEWVPSEEEVGRWAASTELTGRRVGRFVKGVGAAGCGTCGAGPIGGGDGTGGFGGCGPPPAVLSEALREQPPARPTSSVDFGRIFPNLPPFSEANDTVRAALLELGQQGGILDAQDDLAAGPKALIVDPMVNGNPTSTNP